MVAALGQTAPLVAHKQVAAVDRKTRAELWLAAVLRRYYHIKQHTLEAAPPQRFASYDFAAADTCSASAAPRAAAGIPRIVWTWWDTPQPPLLVQRCLRGWARLNPHFSIRILHNDTLAHYLGDIPPAVQQLAPAKRSDWLRLALLQRYGGIWLDASTLLTAPLDWILAEQQQSAADFVGYWLGRYTTDAACPVVESWLMAAPPASAFITAVQREFAQEAAPRSGAAYIQHLRQRGGEAYYQRLRQNIDIPDYLSIHLAMQAVLRSGQAAYRLRLARAEDGPFYLHALGRWNRAALKVRLLFARAHTPPALVKLRQPDRKRLDLYLQQRLYLPGSLAQAFLGEG